jgi:hypothetical protein
VSKQGAQWLSGARRGDGLCRHEFTLGTEDAPKRALLLVSGLGYFQATLVRSLGA